MSVTTIVGLDAFNTRLLAVIEERPDTDADTLATMLVDEMTPAAQRDVLIHLTADEIDIHRRVHARKIEEQARRLAVESPPQSTVQHESPAPTPFARLYDDPTLWRASWGVWLNSRDRRDFAQYVNRRDGEGGYDAWLSGALDVVGDDEDFKMDWIPGYEQNARTTIIAKAVADYTATIRFEVTAELLNAVFATGDGTRVSWRDATVAQHEERIAMLAKMIDGTAETAAMHIRAVQMIKDAGVENLAQLTEREPQ